MKVLLRRNVSKLGTIGEVVEVKPGYARNYLLPVGLAVAPSKANLKIIESEKKTYLEELAKQRAALEVQAKAIEGKEFTIIARANEEGHLYGSVGPAQIAQLIAKEGLIIEDDKIAMDEPIRKLDRYEVPIRFADDLTAKIVIIVIPPADQEFPAPAAAEAPDQAPAPAPEDETK